MMMMMMTSLTDVVGRPCQILEKSPFHDGCCRDGSQMSKTSHLGHDGRELIGWPVAVVIVEYVREVGCSLCDFPKGVELKAVQGR